MILGNIGLLSLLLACGDKEEDTDTGLEDTSSEDTDTSDTEETDTEETDTEDPVEDPVVDLPYTIVDTNQSTCFSSTTGLAEACSGTGYDGDYSTNSLDYTDNGDGTVTDNVTGLIWQQSADLNDDGVIDVSDKLNQEDSESYCEDLSLAGREDWRLPDIKTIYSLMAFSGKDVSGYDSNETSGLTPFIDDSVFGFGYGDTAAGERIIDAQWATTSIYVSTTMNGDETMFGLNLADGRIKGYGMEIMGTDKLFYVQCVRANESYGVNDFTDNTDGTISDTATSLMWSKEDSGSAVSFEDGISYCEDSTLGGYEDWKLPDAKELHSIVDYTRSPDTSSSAAIDSVFNATQFSNEEGEDDYGFYWSATTHENMTNGQAAVYISFGRALGYMNGDWLDVHGAGAQRSDPKDLSSADISQYDQVDGAYTHGPQGDVIRGENYVRCVRVME